MSFGFAPFGGTTFGGVLAGTDPSVVVPAAGLLLDDLGKLEELIWVRPYDPVTASRKDIYLSGGWYASGSGAQLPTGESLAHQIFDGRLVKYLNREIRIMGEGLPSTSAAPNYGEIVVADSRRELLHWLDYEWRNAPLQSYAGSPNWRLGRFATILAGGRVSTLRRDQQTSYTISFGDLIQRLQVSVEKRTYEGHGACLRGDGVDDRVTFGDVLDQTGSFSLRSRIWIESATNSFSRIWSKADATTGWANYINNRNVGFFIRGFSAVFTTASPLIVGQWNEVVVVLNTVAQTVAIWVNGVREAFQTSYTGVPTANTLTLAFGADAGGTNSLVGRWDDPSIWSIALSDEQVRALKGKELTGEEPGLAGAWNFNEASGATVFDLTAGSHNGTIVGAVWRGSLTGTKAVAGKYRAGGVGKRRAVEPILVDEIDLIYEISADGIVDILSDAAGRIIEEGGLRSWIYDGNVATLELLYSTSVAAGHCLLCASRGLIRFGSKPLQPITLGVQFTAEIYPGSIISAMGLRAGLTSDEIDAGALAALPQYEIGDHWALEEKQIDAVIVNMANSLWGYRTTDEQGRLTAAQVPDLDTDAPAGTITGSDVTIAGGSQTGAWPAVRSVTVEYRPYDKVLSSGEVSPSLSVRDRDDRGQEYRSYDETAPDDVLDADASAPTLTFRTALYNEADARAVGARILRFRQVRREPLRLELVRPRYQFQPGQILMATGPFHNCDGGRPVLVIAKTLDDTLGSHILEVAA